MFTPRPTSLSDVLNMWDFIWNKVIDRTQLPLFVSNQQVGIGTINPATYASTGAANLVISGGMYVTGDATVSGQNEINVLPAGVIICYGASSAPNGWVLCDGTSYTRISQARLFAVIGSAFGAADGSHFNVPDMRGIFPKGAGTTNRSAGQDASGNSYAGVLGTYSTDQMQGHIHNLLYYDNSCGFALTSNFARVSTNLTNSNVLGGSINSPVSDGTNGTPRTGHTSEPQSLGLSYIIKT